MDLGDSAKNFVQFAFGLFLRRRVLNTSSYLGAFVSYCTLSRADCIQDFFKLPFDILLCRRALNATPFL